MRNVILGFILAVGAAGVAWAGDYVVVASTDPALKPGLELNGGDRLPLGAGRTASLMSASGEVVTLRGAASGAMAPMPRSGVVDNAKLAQLKMLVAPPVQGRTFGGRRSGVCPDPATLKTLDQIVAAQSGGCKEQAKVAFEAFVAKSSPAP